MSKSYKEKMNEYRTSIDRLDTVLIYTLGERFQQTNKIGKIKAENNLPTQDYDRELHQIKKIRSTATAANLDPTFAAKIFDMIISEVKVNHDKMKK